MPELWDAYDRDGNKLGFDLVRGEPVPEGVYHLVAEIVTVTEDGRVLLTQRHPKKHYGLKWEITGGSVVKGEEPWTAAARELREETGIDLPKEQLRYLYTLTVPKHKSMYHTYLAVLPAPCEVKLQEGETVAYRWLTYDEFKAFTQTEDYAGPLAERLPPLLEALETFFTAVQALK